MTAFRKIVLILVWHIGQNFLSTEFKVKPRSVSAFTPTVLPTTSSSQHLLFYGCHGLGQSIDVTRARSRTSFIPLRAEASLSSVEQEELLTTIRSMRVKELKAELEERKISTADAFEKEELVKRLYDARLRAPEIPKTKASASTRKSTTSTQNADPNVIRGGLSFVSMESGRSISGTYNSEGVQITDAEAQPYPTMTIKVVDGGFPLKLLVDTACSGLVLTPSSVQRNNMRSDSRPVSMSGAGGTGMTAFGTTQIDRFTFEDNKAILGPLLAVVQDTGALEPLGLDGIIGLSFLGQYACTEIDLDRSEISLYKTDYRPPYDETDLEIVAEGELSPTRLGIWTVDTSFDIGGKTGRPIKLLVDTGSTSTILNWKGLEQGLGLSLNSPEVLSQSETGAIGSDNVAMRLTHKIEVDRPVRFGTPNRRSPPQYKGMSIGEGKPPLTVDVGEIALLDTQLSADKVGGILGMNVLSRASRIRMVFSGPIPRITLFQKTNSSSKNSSRDNNGTEDSTDDCQDEDDSQNDSKMVDDPHQVSKVQTESVDSLPTITPPTPSTEETKPRKKKKKRRY